MDFTVIHRLPTKWQGFVKSPMTMWSVVTVIYISLGVTITSFTSPSKPVLTFRDGSVAELAAQVELPYITNAFLPSVLYSTTNVSSSIEVLAEAGAGGAFFTAQGREAVDMGDIFGVSVYHQLHCLQLMREARFPQRQPLGNHGSPTHLRHCIEYVRQAIFCAADTTLEYATMNVSEDGRRTFGFDTGPSARLWGRPRQCRNLGALTGFLKAYTVANYEGWAG